MPHSCTNRKSSTVFHTHPPNPWSCRLPSLPQPYYALTPPIVYLATSAGRLQTLPLLTPQVSGLYSLCCLSLCVYPSGQFLSLSWQGWDPWQQNSLAHSPSRASFQLNTLLWYRSTPECTGCCFRAVPPQRGYLSESKQVTRKGLTVHHWAILKY